MNYLDCYIRVSTKEQAEDGNSLNNQIRIGKSVAKKLKLKFRLRNEGARSSTIHYREVFEELKDEIKQGNVTHVWCLDRSRMFRDMIDSMMFRKEYLEACKVHLYEGEYAKEVQFRDENEMLTYDILSRLQQYENKVRSERSQRGKIDKLKQAIATNKSVYLGGTATFGYVNENKQWKINKDEEKWVKWIFNAYDTGKSTVEIKNELDKQGVKTRRTKSGLWNLGTLQKMLRNKTYTGIHSVYVKKIDKEYSFKVPKIITVSQYNRVQKLLDARLKNASNTKKHFSLLDEIFFCECGVAMGSNHQNYKKNGFNISQKKYFCRSHEYHWKSKTENNCTNKRALVMEETDKVILASVKKIVSNSNLMKEKTKKAVLDEKNKVESDYLNEREKIENKIQRIQKQIDSIENNIVDLELEKGLGKRDASIVDKVISRYEQELEHQHNEYKSSESELDALDSNLVWVDWVSKFSDDLETTTRTKENKQEFLRGLVDIVIVHSELGLDRNEKEVQVGHSFDIKFKMPIVNDKLIYNDEENKTKGYEVKKGKKVLKLGLVAEATQKRGRKSSKKKQEKVQN